MNKIVVITGSESGIGLALKQKYEECGDIVVRLDLSIIKESATAYACDVSNEQRVKEIFEKIETNFHKVDVLINCAGYATFGATELIENQSVQNLFNCNYFGCLNTCKQAIPLMPRGSRIVNISSACAIFAVPFRTHYCAVKAAVSMLSFGLRMELFESGIDVVAVCPGDIKTNFSKNRVKNTATNSRYGDQIAKCAKQLEDKEESRMPVDYAAGKIFDCITKKKCKAMYVIGKKTKMFNVANKVLPLDVILTHTRKKY